MTDTMIRNWLHTLDPNTSWDLDDIDALERQVIYCVKQSGFLNLRRLLNRPRYRLAKDIPIRTYTKDGKFQVIGYPFKQGNQVLAVQDECGQVTCMNVNDLDWPDDVV